MHFVCRPDRLDLRPRASIFPTDRCFPWVQTETERVPLSYQPLAQGDTRILQDSTESILLLERIDPLSDCLYGASVRHGSVVAEECLHNGGVLVRCIHATDGTLAPLIRTACGTMIGHEVN